MANGVTAPTIIHKGQMMNKRIQELADKAKLSVPPGIMGVDQWVEAYNEELAKLIIQDCGMALNTMLRDMISRGHAYDLIQQHFGVDK